MRAGVGTLPGVVTGTNATPDGEAAQPTRDRQTVTPEGEPLEELPFGASLREIRTHVDDRGTLFELYDPRWAWHPEPMVFSYCATVRPGRVKGWAIHREHEDRYALMFGEAKVVLYDDRAGSPTFGLVSQVHLSEHRRQLLNIPIGVWHATQNLGDKDLVIVNFPTKPFNHANPDKFRLPLDTDQIPYRFEGVHGW
jgi:dTDP-4-dehydrorhamnose 3,5-epimerase